MTFTITSNGGTFEIHTEGETAATSPAQEFLLDPRPPQVTIEGSNARLLSC